MSTAGSAPPRSTSARLRGSLGWALAIIAACDLFLLMVITCIDVTGRELLLAPLPGAVEITELMMAVLIFSALPICCAQDKHITIDLLDRFVPARIARWQQVAVNLVGAIAMGVVTWRLAVLAGQRARYGDITEYLLIPLAPIAYVMSALAGAATVVMLLNLWRYARGVQRRPAAGVL